jgi:hypothetical protein
MGIVGAEQNQRRSCLLVTRSLDKAREIGIGQLLIEQHDVNPVTKTFARSCRADDVDDSESVRRQMVSDRLGRCRPGADEKHRGSSIGIAVL